MAEPWVSVEEVASHLGVRKDSIYRWIEHRGLPAQRIGKLWKLKLSEIDVWVRARGAGVEPPGSIMSRNQSRSSNPSRVTPGDVSAGDVSRNRVILVIDDDELVRDTLHDFLSDEGYVVILASDGAEALQILDSASPRPHLIILDLKMPNLDGWRFRELQASNPNLASIPVIVVTAVPGTSVIADAILRKPLRLDQLAKAIENQFPENSKLTGEKPRHS